jgi:prophage maintenance system killer protein
VLLNELRLAATNAELEELTIGMAAGRISKDDTVAFFRKHVAAS